jgi:AcrR family transcriptional regulator
MTRTEDLPDDVMGMPPSRKGARRKAEIIDAALRIIGRDGILEVSMRAVAVEASVPLGTVTYYFSNKEELIEAAFLRHTQRETARVVAAITRLGGLTQADLARGLADFVIQGLTEYREQLVTEYQFLNAPARHESLQRASTAWLQSLSAHLEERLAAFSSSNPKTDAKLILSVVSGLEVDHLSAPLRPADERAIRAVLERLFRGLGELWGQEQG